MVLAGEEREGAGMDMRLPAMFFMEVVERAGVGVPEMDMGRAEACVGEGVEPR